ncbi:MAG TPA: arylesterase, partial [Clostridiales bacterium]|nr:arylesterase [Clostridiales bacterium]
MKHVLCFGDSNTWGFIPGTCKRYDEHTRWTGVLQDELGADWRIHENGQNGRTTVFPEPSKNFMTGLGALPYALDTLRPLDAIIIMLGTND